MLQGFVSRRLLLEFFMILDVEASSNAGEKVLSLRLSKKTEFLGRKLWKSIDITFCALL